METFTRACLICEKWEEPDAVYCNSSKAWLCPDCKRKLRKLIKVDKVNKVNKEG